MDGEKHYKYQKFRTILESFEIEDVQYGKIKFKNPKNIDKYLELLINSLFNLPFDYKEDFAKFYSKFNRKNPYRIDTLYGSAPILPAGLRLFPWWRTDPVSAGPRHRAIVPRPRK